MVAVPAAMPVTVPVAEPTVAFDVLLLLHVPLPVTSVNAVVSPIHTVPVPVMPEGTELTVIVVAAVQPAPLV